MFRILIICFIIPAISFSQDYDALTNYLSSQHRQGKFNGIILLADKGRIVYEKSFGQANMETTEPITNSHHFETGSVTKQFTAAAIIILKEKGMLSYDDPVTKYFKEFAVYPNITIRNLLDHTSGLAEYLRYDSLFNRSIINTNADVIHMLVSNKPALNFEPGKRHLYSNTNYVLLASIVEKVSGQSFEDFMEQQIFDPVGMNNTHVHRGRFKPRHFENYAYGYYYSDSLKKYMVPDFLPGHKRVIYLDGIQGDGMVNSTAHDLLKWDRALYTSKLISKQSLEEAFTPTPVSLNNLYPYGFGWRIIQHPIYGKIVSHEGTWGGYHALFERHITNDKTIIVLTNTHSSMLPGVAARRALYQLNLPTDKKSSSEELEKYTGTFKMPDGSVLKIFESDGFLLGSAPGDQVPVKLYPSANNKYFRLDFEVELEFKNELNEHFSLIILNFNGRKLSEMTRIDP